MKNYMIVSADTPGDLASAVNQHLKSDDYFLIGGVAVTPNNHGTVQRFYQAIALKDD